MHLSVLSEEDETTDAPTSGDGGASTNSTTNRNRSIVSIREDENFQKHVKRQGHRPARSAMAVSAHGRLEGGEAAASVVAADARNDSSPTGSLMSLLRSKCSRSGSGGLGSERSDPKPAADQPGGGVDRHGGAAVAAKKQGHNSSLSRACLVSERSRTECTDAGDKEREYGSNHGDGGVGVNGDVFKGNSERVRSIEEDEMHARDGAESRTFALFFWNGISSVLVFARYLISIDSLLSVLLSCGLTYYTWMRTIDENSFDGSMNFILLGFAVLMPLSVSVRITFSRREKALENIAHLQTNAQQIYLCHACWDWGSSPGERSKDPDRWLKHSDKVLRVLIAIGDELTRFLTMPNSSFSRHRETVFGRREAAVTIGASYRIFGDVIDRRVTRLSTLLEELKLAGFSASEASRVRQYEKLLTQSVQNLRMLKMYRSPKALNALLNLTTTLLPPFYAPAFAQIAHDSGLLGMGIAFAAITSLALKALYESVQVLEDPFVAFLSLDGIDVYEELAVLYYHQLVETRRELFPKASLFSEVDEQDDSISEISELDTKDHTTVSESPVLDRRTMMLAGKNHMSSTKVTGKQRRASMMSMKRQSAYNLDLPPEFKRGGIRSSASSEGKPEKQFR